MERTPCGVLCIPGVQFVPFLKFYLLLFGGGSSGAGDGIQEPGDARQVCTTELHPQGMFLKEALV